MADADSPNPELDNRIHTVALRCLQDGVYPSEENLRRHGASGHWSKFQAALERLIASGALVLPPWAEEGRRRGLAIRQGLRDRGRQAPATIPTPKPRAKPESVPRPKAARPAQHDPRPCADESRAYWKAWRSVHKIPKAKEDARV